MLRYRAPLVRYFQRRGLNLEAAEDATHEVFLRVSRIDQSGINNREAYLFTIAASVIVDQARRARSRHEQAHRPLDDFLPGDEPSPARIFEGREALERLAVILDELPDRTREIFLLNRLDGLSYTQLATRYDLSVKSIEKRMSRALAHLRSRYEFHD